MAILSDLPLELLECVYHYLDSIDDVHHLGRACRKTHNVLGHQKTHLSIMRTIIQQRFQHRFDYQLCKILRLHQKVVEHFEHNNSQLPATLVQPSGATTVINKWEQALILATSTDGMDDVELFSDEMIYDILARYQGLRILEDKWLGRQLISPDFLSTDTTSDPNDFIHAHQVLLQRAQEFRDEGGISRNRQTPESQFYVNLNADQRGRFHAAIISVWILNEIRWVLTNFEYPATFHMQVGVLMRCRAQLEKEVHNPMLDDLDRFAVFRFLYHHTLPLSGVFLADRDSSKLPLTFSTEFGNEAVRSARLLQTFLLAGQTYMQPPDIIDLMVRSETSRRAPYPQMTLPPTSERWMRPSTNFAIPPNIQILSQQNSLSRGLRTHLSLIIRSSFHQSRYDPRQNSAALYVLQDYAQTHFFEKVVQAFELDERCDGGRVILRTIFQTFWSETSWSTWWWANSEEKARAKMERWKESTSKILREL